MIDAVHQRHPCQKAEDEADDGRSFVHHDKPRSHRSPRASVIDGERRCPRSLFSSRTRWSRRRAAARVRSKRGRARRGSWTPGVEGRTARLDATPEGRRARVHERRALVNARGARQAVRGGRNTPASCPGARVRPRPTIAGARAAAIGGKEQLSVFDQVSMVPAWTTFAPRCTRWPASNSTAGSWQKGSGCPFDARIANRQHGGRRVRRTFPAHRTSVRWPLPSARRRTPRAHM